MVGNSGESGPIAALVVAAHDKKFSDLELRGESLGRVASGRPQEYNAVDLSGTFGHDGVGGGIAAHACADDGDRVRTRRVQVSNRGQDVRVRIVVDGSGSGFRLSIPAEIDRQNAEARVGENLRLFFPTLFVEAAAVNQDHGSDSVAIEIGVEAISVRGGEGNMRLRAGEGRECEDRQG